MSFRSRELLKSALSTKEDINDPDNEGGGGSFGDEGQFLLPQ